MPSAKNIYDTRKGSINIVYYFCLCEDFIKKQIDNLSYFYNKNLYQTVAESGDVNKYFHPDLCELTVVFRYTASVKSRRKKPVTPFSKQTCLGFYQHVYSSLQIYNKCRMTTFQDKNVWGAEWKKIRSLAIVRVKSRTFLFPAFKLLVLLQLCLFGYRENRDTPRKRSQFGKWTFSSLKQGERHLAIACPLPRNVDTVETCDNLNGTVLNTTVCK